MQWSVTPDYKKPENSFRDHIIASEAIAKMKDLNAKSEATGNPFLLSIGFKLPHTQYHIPGRYFNMYAENKYLNAISKLHNDRMKLSTGKGDTGNSWHHWNRNGSYPVGAPLMNYRCCAKDIFKSIDVEKVHEMKHERWPSKVGNNNNKQRLYGLMNVQPNIRYELLRGYFSGITFLDEQVMLCGSLG